MAFSIIEFLTKIVIGVFVGGLIGVPIVYIIWRLKMKKIRKNIPLDMKEQIKKFKINERRVEDEKEKREDSRKARRNQRAVDAIKSNTWNSVKNLGGGKGFGEYGKIPKTTPSPIKRTKPDSKGAWPSFE